MRRALRLGLRALLCVLSAVVLAVAIAVWPVVIVAQRTRAFIASAQVPIYPGGIAVAGCAKRGDRVVSYRVPAPYGRDQVARFYTEWGASLPQCQPVSPSWVGPVGHWVVSPYVRLRRAGNSYVPVNGDCGKSVLYEGVWLDKGHRAYLMVRLAEYSLLAQDARPSWARVDRPPLSVTVVLMSSARTDRLWHLGRLLIRAPRFGMSRP